MWGDAQNPPNHLPVQSEAFCWARKDQAGGLRAIPSLGQHSAVANDIYCARRKTLEDCFALLDWSRSVNVLGQCAGPSYLRSTLRTRCMSGTNSGGPATFAQSMPVLDNIAHQLGGIDPLGQLRFDIVTTLHADPG